MSHETLVIAPLHPELGMVPDEAASIAAAMEGRLLQGEVDARRLIDHIDGRQYGRIWICSHADERGIWLTDDVLTADQLSWICNTVGAEELVINTCSSGIFVTNIQLASDVDILFSLADVPDREAMIMANSIAQTYTRTENLEAAYKKSTGGTGLYKYLPNGKRQQRVTGSNQDLSNGQLSRAVIQNQLRHEEAGRRMVAIENQISRLGVKIDTLTDDFRNAKHMTVVNHPASESLTGEYRIIFAAFIIGTFVFAGLYFGGA
jgi:hypothetical protein